MALANWRFEDFAGKAQQEQAAHPPLNVSSNDAHFDEAFDHGLDLADATNYAASFAGHVRPYVCTPMVGSPAEARKLARKPTSMHRHRLQRCAAPRHGRTGQRRYGFRQQALPGDSRTHSARSAKHITLALVGKTVYLRHGGYSLKINNTMKGMKYDKWAAWRCWAQLNAVARAKLPVHVVRHSALCREHGSATIPIAPIDIITNVQRRNCGSHQHRCGGRLVLRDALAYACKDTKATQHRPNSRHSPRMVVAAWALLRRRVCQR